MSATVPHALVWYVSWPKCMLIVSAKQVLASSMLVFGANVSNAFAEAPPPKQGFYIRPDQAFNDLWVHHKRQPPIPRDISYLSCPPCKDTLNHLVFGRNMRMRFFGRSALPPQCTNRACTQDTSTAIVSFSCAKSMTLPLLHQTNEWLIFFRT